MHTVGAWLNNAAQEQSCLYSAAGLNLSPAADIREELRIVALAVIEPDGKVNERLQEEPARTAFRRPSLLERFVALEKLTAVEEPESALQ
jgi:hypothetical protein